MNNNETKLKHIAERCEEWIEEAERQQRSNYRCFTIAEEEENYVEMGIYRDRRTLNELHMLRIKTLLDYIESSEE